MSTDTISLLPTVNEGGRTWHRFAADFTSDDGTFSIYFYAISKEHACHVLDDIKSTATLRGMVEVIK